MTRDFKGGRGPIDFGALVAPIWFAGWQFTIGFAHLSFWKGVLASVLWPYFLGVALK